MRPSFRVSVAEESKQAKTHTDVCGGVGVVTCGVIVLSRLLAVGDSIMWYEQV